MFDKRKQSSQNISSPSKESSLIIDLQASDVTCSITTLGASTIKKISNIPGLPSKPQFFEIYSHNTKYVFGAHDSHERSRWQEAIADSLSKSPGYFSGNRWDVLGMLGSSTGGGEKAVSEGNDLVKSSELKTGNSSATSGLEAYSKGPIDNDDDDEDDDHDIYLCKNSTLFKVKIDTFVRLMKIITAFPFVIVVSSFPNTAEWAWLRSLSTIRCMNFLVYMLPIVFVTLVLSQSKSQTVQLGAMACYLGLYLIPVTYSVADRLRAAAETSQIKEGTFSFKPATSMRLTMANLSMLSGIFYDWFLHIFYVVPLGIITQDRATTLEELSIPFGMKGDFRVYFWIGFICIIVCDLILILNSGLRGKLQYSVNNSQFVWFFYFNMGSPYFVSIVTVMFMGLSCDYTVDPPVLVQRSSMECWSVEHSYMAFGALLGLALFLVPVTLLPGGTFKETMTDNSLDIMFVPVYLQAYCILQAIFCGVFVSFYTENITRCVTLTILNIMMLLLNRKMKPCSVEYVNILREAFDICAVFGGFQALCYVVWQKTEHQSLGLYCSLLIINQGIILTGMYLFYLSSRRSSDFMIANAFLNLEWQVSRGGTVEPRVLEPLIAMTLSDVSCKSYEDDLKNAKKYIAQLVWLLNYPNIRVQFQSAWALANLAGTDEDSRQKIHDAGGTKSLFQWYADMNPFVQVETLAALCNLTLSKSVSFDMVYKYDCIQFFLDLIHSPMALNARFASIAIGNLAREEKFRELIKKANGIQILVGCIMSHEYQKRRYACSALANMALSTTKELEQIFLSKGLMRRVMKIASRNEKETQREVIGLLRALSCHPSLRRSLLDRGIIKAIKKPSTTSPFPEVIEWCNEIVKTMEREVSYYSYTAQVLDVFIFPHNSALTEIVITQRVFSIFNCLLYSLIHYLMHRRMLIS